MSTTIVEHAVEALCQKAGTKILQANWRDPVLVILADGWRITATCGWRITSGGRLETGSDEADATEDAKAIEGAVLAGAVAYTPLDPALLFKDGRRLELFSAASFEPWIIRIDGADVPVFVASPTEPL